MSATWAVSSWKVMSYMFQLSHYNFIIRNWHFTRRVVTMLADTSVLRYNSSVILKVIWVMALVPLLLTEQAQRRSWWPIQRLNNDNLASISCRGCSHNNCFCQAIYLYDREKTAVTFLFNNWFNNRLHQLFQGYQHGFHYFFFKLKKLRTY